MTQNGKKISETGLKDLKRLFKKFGFDLTDELWNKSIGDEIGYEKE